MSENKNTEMSLEDIFKDLDQIIAQMESGELPLDQAFSLYELGVCKVKECTLKLDMIEKKMLELKGAGEVVEF